MMINKVPNSLSYLPCEYSDCGFESHELLGESAIQRSLCHHLLMQTEKKKQGTFLVSDFCVTCFANNRKLQEYCVLSLGEEPSPSSAKAACPMHKNAKIFSNHLNPVMLVLIG